MDRDARRIAVTGLGAISALGHDATAMWRALADGTSGIAPMLHPQRDALRTTIAAQVKDFDPDAHFDAHLLSQLDRVTQFALVAAREAMAQSKLGIDPSTASRVAVVVGTGVGGELSRDEQSRKLYAEAAQRVHPLSIVRAMSNAPASRIAMAIGATGPAFAVASACASSNHAMAQAVLMIRAGLADVAVTGGTEACLGFSLIKAWEAMRVLADDTCRPFCLQRRGLVLGEGAGIFVLESFEHARRRGATILAELAGVGMSADAGDIVAPSAGGAAAAMRAALEDAGLSTTDIDYVNAHGTGTPANDVAETQAIRAVFGTHADRLAVSSTKSMHGHALGAAGALELIAVLGALREGIVPPTANYLDPDPACDLDIVPNLARRMPVRAALSNSFAFGGLNAVLALTRYGPSL